MMNKMIKTYRLKVLLHGKDIGVMTLLPGDQSIFSFDQSYIDNTQRPTLSLSFQNIFGDLILKPRVYRTRAHPFFSNLLPEGQLRDYLAKSSHINPVHELRLLQALGEDLPGAVQVIPFDPRTPFNSSATEISGEPEKQNVPRLHFSLAGVQIKFSAVASGTFNNGLTIPTRGIGGKWIIKLPSMRFAGVPENEFSMMFLAKMVGINVPDIRILKMQDIENLPSNIGNMQGSVFSVKRFDRYDNDEKIHIEDFAQVFGVYPAKKYQKAKYQTIATVLAQETDQESIEEFIRRLIFCTLIGNDDMHLKNWSLLYADKKNPQLSPAYDLLSTIAYIPSQDMALKYSNTRSMYELSYQELTALAVGAKIPLKRVIDTTQEMIERFLSAWAQEKNNLMLYPEVVRAIDQHLSKLLILRK